MATKKTKTTAKKITKKPQVVPASTSPRRIKPIAKISGSFRLFGRSLKLLLKQWKLFGSITLIYGVLTLILVHGLTSGLDLKTLKLILEKAPGTSSSPLGNATTLFNYVVSAAGRTTDKGASVYQTFLIILLSLVIIWALRQVLAAKKVSAKDAFYNGIYPLVPFVIVLVVIGIELIPLAIAAKLFSIIMSNRIAAAGWEKLSWDIVFSLLMFWSVYMISSSIFALYVVTLPDMKPFKALRSAKLLVKHRRFKVIRKVIFLPLALIVLGLVITVPLILLLTSYATWAFFVLSLFILPIVHAYMYILYRELL